jgi:hypothetical protein
VATTITGIASSKVISNLDTYNHTTGNSGPYLVHLAVSERPPSGVIITIQQNSVTKATTTAAPAAAQQLVELKVLLNCAIGDIISVIVTSVSPSDTGPNVIKGTLAIGQGSGLN